jgi:hypothetical protein
MRAAGEETLSAGELVFCVPIVSLDGGSTWVPLCCKGHYHSCVHSLR